MPTRRTLLLLPLAPLLAACTLLPPAKQAFVVFFAPWSAELDAEAAAAIDRAAALAKSAPGAVVHVVGYADPEGSTAANVELSRLRAQRVVDALLRDGVPPARVRQSGRGPTGFAQSSVESRRVVITIDGL